MSEGSLESPTGHAIMKAVHASLRLASGSMELLTISQLLTVKGDLYETLTIFNKRVQAMESGSFAENVLGDTLQLTLISQRARA
jgi:hypothetical protein